MSAVPCVLRPKRLILFESVTPFTSSYLVAAGEELLINGFGGSTLAAPGDTVQCTLRLNGVVIFGSFPNGSGDASPFIIFNFEVPAFGGDVIEVDGFSSLGGSTVDVWVTALQGVPGGVYERR